MKLLNKKTAPYWTLLALVGTTMGFSQVSQTTVGAFHELVDPFGTNAISNCLAGEAMGEYVMPAGAVGRLTGELAFEGDLAYTLQADLTTYLPIFGQRETRYGGIEGVLVPASPHYIVPNDLLVLGGWSQAPGEAATFQTHVIEVNSVTGTVYGMVGAIHGSFTQKLGCFADLRTIVRHEGPVTPLRAIDKEPPEGCFADLRTKVRHTGALVDGSEVPRARGDDIPPPPAVDGSSVPGIRAPDVLGGVHAATAVGGQAFMGWVVDHPDAASRDSETGLFFATWAIVN